MEKFPKNISFENTFEKSQNEFSLHLQKIINTQINDENIKTFANDSMGKLISLIDKIKNAYQKETNSNLTGKDLEDRALAYYNLRGINELLNKIQNKKDQIEEIYEYIKNIPKDDKIIVPPGQLEKGKISKGDIPWERKRNIPRLATLLYILETDFNISKEEINILEGIVTNEQMRTEPYYRVEIDELNRLVYVCIEEGNVTYIFDQEKLKENHIEVESMDILTKQKRNEALKKYPNLGTKLNQSSRWRENISELLAAEKLEHKNTSPIEKETINDENIPKVSTSEFDEWRGFWTDPEGKHWSNKFTLAKRAGLTWEIINPHIGTLTYRDIKERGIIRQSYRYEDLILIPEIQKRINTVAVAKKDNLEQNQWKGFWTDENGKHWANIRVLAELTGVESHIINKYIKNLPQKEIRGRRNTIGPAYCYEDLILIPEIQKRIDTINTVTKENNLEQNQWKGFWTDENGKHWSNIKNLAKYIGLSYETINKNVKILSPKNIKDKAGRIKPSYCYEDLILIPKIKELINNPTVANKDDIEQNQWYGFWTDENGKHWANIKFLAKRTGLNTQIITIYINALPSREIKNFKGTIRHTWCYEDLIIIPEIKKRINTVSVARKNNLEQNQWKGFWTDKDGKHWAHIRVLEAHTGIESHTINKYIKNLPQQEVKGRQNTIWPAYCYEDLILIPEIKKRIDTVTSVTKEDNLEQNQWKGFWTDENGKHWANKGVLANHLKLDRHTIIEYVKKLSPKEIRDINGIIRPSYCYEEVIQLPKIQELLRKKKLKEEKQE